MRRIRPRGACDEVPMSRTVSALGDAALLLPATLLLIAYLAILGRFAAARALAVSVAACGLLTIAAKLVFHACGPSMAELDVISPSGHVSFAAIFYGSLAIMLGTGRPRPQRWLLGAGAGLLLVVVGISRVRMNAHSPEEVVAGFLIGGASVLLFMILYARSTHARLGAAPLLAGFAIALLALGGRHLTLEHVIGGAARRLSSTFDICPEPPHRSAQNQASPGGRFHLTP